ncbi:hypothetical protein BGZ81_008637 [Podila clonocystis]|nr:hypothetical protein BGZ81_008637 [Podila clonocystis]
MATHSSTRAKASLFMALTLSTSMVLAQDQTTLQPIRRQAFVQIGDKLYIQGGFSSTTFVQDFFVVDLASSWATASPTVKNLPAGQLTSHHGLAAVGGGAQILAVGGLNNPSSFVRSFDLATQRWTNAAGTPPFATGLEGLTAVTDPATGQVYVIGGNNVGSSTVAPSQYNGVMVYDPTSTKFATQQPATNTTSLTDPGVVWSTVRKSILVFGGSLAPPVSPVGLDLTAVREYDPVSKSWKTMVTTGDVPPARFDHCVAASEDGSRIVLFGGAKDTNVNYDTLYVLDVAAGTWKQGQSASTTRTKFACAFYKNQFVAHGGSAGADRKTMLDNVVAVYNLDRGQWVDSYAGSTTGSAGSSGSSSNIGVIAGVAGGVVALLIVIGAFWWFRRRRAAKEREAYESDARAAAAIGHEDEHRRPNGWSSHQTPKYHAHRESQHFLNSQDKDASHYQDDYSLDRLKNPPNHLGHQGRNGYFKDAASIPGQRLEYDHAGSGYSDGDASFTNSSNNDYSRHATGSSNPDSGKGGSEYLPPTPSTAYNFTSFSGSNASQTSPHPAPSGAYSSAFSSLVPPAPFEEYYQGKVSYYETDSTPSATAFSPHTNSTARTSVYRAPHSPTELNQQFISPLNSPQTTDNTPPSSSWGSPYPPPPPSQQQRYSMGRSPQHHGSSSGYIPPPPPN